MPFGNVKTALSIFLDIFFTTQICHKKSGLVFSGGGSQRYSHIGVLKALEKMKFCYYIVGTSMGGIVGAVMPQE